MLPFDMRPDSLGQGRGSLVGCCLWGRTESDMTEVTQQQQQQQQQWEEVSANLRWQCKSPAMTTKREITGKMR